MAKTFKVVCINTGRSGLFLNVGQVYTANKYNGDMSSYNIRTQGGNENYSYKREYFLLLPAEPKKCADMTMEEYLAMVCLRATDRHAVQVKRQHDKWAHSVDHLMPNKSYCGEVYRVKPEKSDKDIEIERIEGEMRKLADDLAKIKGG